MMARLIGRWGATLLAFVVLLCLLAMAAGRQWPSYQIAYVQQTANRANLNYVDTLYLYDMRHDIRLPLHSRRNIGNLHWSNDGRFLAVNAQDSAQFLSQLVVFDIATGQHYAPNDNVVYGALTWSPDNRTLAVHRTDDSLMPNELVTVDVTAQTVTLLSDDVLGMSNLAWSPDGRWISYRVEPYNKPPRLRLMDVASGEWQPLLTDVPFELQYSGGQPAIWSPDGQELILNRGIVEQIAVQDLPIETAIVDIDTRELRYLRINYPAMFIDASSNGKQIVFGGTFRVYDPFSGATNTTARRGRYDLTTDSITLLPDDCEAPHWSPDDAWILCRTLVTLYRVRPDGSDQQTIFNTRIIVADWRP